MKPSLLRETEEIGGDKSIALFSQKIARNYDDDELFLSAIKDL